MFLLPCPKAVPEQLKQQTTCSPELVKMSKKKHGLGQGFDDVSKSSEASTEANTRVELNLKPSANQTSAIWRKTEPEDIRYPKTSTVILSWGRAC